MNLIFICPESLQEEWDTCYTLKKTEGVKNVMSEAALQTMSKVVSSSNAHDLHSRSCFSIITLIICKKSQNLTFGEYQYSNTITTCTLSATVPSFLRGTCPDTVGQNKSRWGKRLKNHSKNTKYLQLCGRNVAILHMIIMENQQLIGVSSSTLEAASVSTLVGVCNHATVCTLQMQFICFMILKRTLYYDKCLIRILDQDFLNSNVVFPWHTNTSSTFVQPINKTGAPVSICQEEYCLIASKISVVHEISKRHSFWSCDVNKFSQRIDCKELSGEKEPWTHCFLPRSLGKKEWQFGKENAVLKEDESKPAVSQPENCSRPACLTLHAWDHTLVLAINQSGLITCPWFCFSKNKSSSSSNNVCIRIRVKTDVTILSNGINLKVPSTAFIPNTSIHPQGWALEKCFCVIEGESGYANCWSAVPKGCHQKLPPPQTILLFKIVSCSY